MSDNRPHGYVIYRWNVLLQDWVAIDERPVGDAVKITPHRFKQGGESRTGKFREKVIVWCHPRSLVEGEPCGCEMEYCEKDGDGNWVHRGCGEDCSGNCCCPIDEGQNSEGETEVAICYPPNQCTSGCCEEK